jgi:hypothetical protein
MRLAVALALLMFLISPGAAPAQLLCEASVDADAPNIVAIVDVTVIEIVPVAGGAEARTWINRIVQDDTGMLAPDTELRLPTSPPGTRMVGEVPFDEWREWRLFLKPLEPGSTQLITSLCDGSTMIPRPIP